VHTFNLEQLLIYVTYRVPVPHCHIKRVFYLARYGLVNLLTHRMQRPFCLSTDKVSGSLLDWAYDKAKIKYTYLPELRPAMRSQGGFTPPISFILPSGEELFAALVTCCRHIAKLWDDKQLLCFGHVCLSYWQMNTFSRECNDIDMCCCPSSRFMWDECTCSMLW